MVDPDTFRSVLGRFASGVSVVTTVGREGADHGMTVSAFCSVSLEPPFVLVCIDRATAMDKLLPFVEHIGISFLEESQEALSRRFAEPEPDRFDGVGFTRGRHGVPLLDGAIAHLECSLVTSHEAGDHRIHIGRVEEAAVLPGRPLLYYRSGYTGLER